MQNLFIRRLEHGMSLSGPDRAALSSATQRVRRFGPREVLAREGEHVSVVHVFFSGFACRFKARPNGTRQIVDYLLPGDACHLHTAILSAADHSITTLSACTVAEVPHSVIEELTANSPGIARALWWASLASEGTAREWILNVARRPADKRMAHLFSELLVRLQSVGVATANSFEMPITQADLGDTLGITPIHVNRMLQSLRDADLITLKGGHLTVPDVDRLHAFAEFNAAYLHLSRRGRGTQLNN